MKRFKVGFKGVFQKVTRCALRGMIIDGVNILEILIFFRNLGLILLFGIIQVQITWATARCRLISESDCKVSEGPIIWTRNNKIIVQAF